MDDNRPNPDAVLAQVQAEEAREGKGKLKLFFGFAAGVGKTYTMLETARRDVSSGRDVWIGVVETHGRSDTAALLLGMEILPLKDIEYRGVTLKEFDLDGALELHPELILVDELAHTNAPGSRHAKRWQDVEELLAAGIDVYTTLNVQHLESLNDVVAQITGVIVQETVPDAVLERADEIELVDLPPEDLLERFRHGLVYVPAQAQKAIQHFFKKPNLIALRELALRQMADRVNQEMQRARLGGTSPQVWPTTDRLLVCVSPSPLSPRVIRTAKRMSTSLRADWIAAYVEPADPELMDSKARQRLAQNLRLAEQLGAEIVTLAGSNPADELLSYARVRNVTRIVVGKSGKQTWRRFFRRNLVDDLLRHSREIDVHVIHGVEEPETKPPPPERHRVEWPQYARAMGVVAVCGAVDALIFRQHLAESNLVMVFLLGVAYVAARYGRGPAILASIASVLAFDFFFVRPYLTFAVSDTQYVLTFMVMLGIAVLISTLMSRIRDQAQISRQRARRTEALYHMSHRLTGQVGTHQLANVALQQLTANYAGEVAIFLPDEEKRLRIATGSHAEFTLRENEAAVAQWVFAHQQPAGLGTSTLPSAHALYLPLAGSQGSVGVLAIRPADPEQLLVYDQRQLLETFARQIALALERELLAAQVQAVLLQAETERLRSSLLASVSHDLRTPLAVITGASSSLLESEEGLSPETRRELYQTIYDDANRLSRLVDNLLDMTRIESGSVVVNKQEHFIEEVVGSALSRLGKQLAGRQVATHVSPDLPLVPLDDMLIEQVLTNLLENVQKYTPPGSPIDVSAWLENRHVLIEVADRGPGLPDDELDKVFEKFYRGQAAALDGRRGAGLGLAICKAIVTAHGGRIWADNRPGGGARFCFSLPIGAPETARPKAAEHEGSRQMARTGAP
ncbi:MAG TPA: sensor histidine kinase KdpD [Pirellulales bacterium]|nr:sensor histidine kinase KdpD [Pirellulales bacterium]